jgi:hypothetical protein
MGKVKPSPASITSQALVNFISTSFDEGELKGLCFQLEIDYEDLPTPGKSNKARDLVRLMQRMNRLGNLVETVQQLRPHLGVNIQRLTRQVLEQDDPRLQGVESLITQFRQYYQQLREWKELHNHLDEILNVFGQYAAQVERFAEAGTPINLDPLTISWQPVHRRIIVLLTWAEQDVQHIGRPFRLLDNGEREGEKWAVELAELHQSLNGYLREHPTEHTIEPGQRWYRPPYFFRGEAGQAGLWPEWWRGLRELTRSLDNSLKTHMFMADKELRKTAVALYDLSRETLWS